MNFLRSVRQVLQTGVSSLGKRKQQDRDLLQRGVAAYKRVERIKWLLQRPAETTFVDLTAPSGVATAGAPAPQPSQLLRTARDWLAHGAEDGFLRAASPMGNRSSRPGTSGPVDAVGGDAHAASRSAAIDVLPESPSARRADRLRREAAIRLRVAREEADALWERVDAVKSNVAAPSRRELAALKELADVERQVARLRLEKEAGAAVGAAAAVRPGAVQLPDGAQEEYDSLVSRSGDGVLAEHARSGIAVRPHDLATLAPGAWLNDEVINLTCALLQERDARLRSSDGGGSKRGDSSTPPPPPRCHFFSTFFCNKLYKDAGYSYGAVRRWTTPKRLASAGQPSSCLLDCDRIIVPVHQGVHWTLAVADIANKELRYYDALLGEDEGCLEALARWLVDEARDKRGVQDYDALSWPHLFPKNIPRQLNGCDCGMFMLVFADYQSRDVRMEFTQADMQRFRIKAVLDIMKLQIS